MNNEKTNNHKSKEWWMDIFAECLSYFMMFMTLNVITPFLSMFEQNRKINYFITAYKSSYPLLSPSKIKILSDTAAEMGLMTISFREAFSSFSQFGEFCLEIIATASIGIPFICCLTFLICVLFLVGLLFKHSFLFIIKNESGRINYKILLSIILLLASTPLLFTPFWEYSWTIVLCCIYAVFDFWLP